MLQAFIGMRERYTKVYLCITIVKYYKFKKGYYGQII